MDFYTPVRKKSGWLISLMIASLCLLSASAFAVSKLEKNLDRNGYNVSSMVTPSSDIVIAKVKSLSSKWVGKVIITTADVEPIEMLKGKSQVKSLKVSYIGGTVGNIRQTLSHPIELVDGETAVLFLTDAHKSSGVAGTKVFSHSQGKIHLLDKDENINLLKSNKRISGLVNKIQAEANMGGVK